jgi:hypothetical protein
MASHLVGVMGKKRHGKDTFASRLVDVHGFTRVAFADPLKAAAEQLNPLVLVDFDNVGPLRAATSGVEIFHGGDTVRLKRLVDIVGWEAAKEVREVRRILQELGVSIRDNVDPEAWVRAAFRVVDSIPGPVVITDVRFPNEVAAVRRARGLLAYVENARIPDSGDSHVSENAVSRDDADRLIPNNGTIEELHLRADRLAGGLLD